MLNYFFIFTGKEDAMVKGLKVILTTTVLLLIIIFAGCSGSSNPTGHVTMAEKPMYLEVYIDYSSGNRYDIGREYGTKVLSTAPDYEKIFDKFLKLQVSSMQQFYPEITPEVMVQRVLEISKSIQSEYMDELEG